MKKLTLIVLILVAITCVQAQENHLKTFQKTIDEMNLAVENGIILGNSILKIDSFYDDIDSTWLVDEYWTSDPMILGEYSSLGEVLTFNIAKYGNIKVMNGDAAALSQGRGHLMSPMSILEEFTGKWYADMLEAVYLPLLEDQRFFYLFYCEVDYTPQQLRSKFSTKQEIDGFDMKFNLGSAIDLESAIKTSPHIFESLMSKVEHMEIFAISPEDRFRMESTSTFVTGAGRVQRSYTSVVYATASLSKYSVESTDIFATYGHTMNDALKTVVPAGSYVLLTSKNTAGL